MQVMHGTDTDAPDRSARGSQQQVINSAVTALRIHTLEPRVELKAEE